METPFEIPPLTPGRRPQFTVTQKRALLAEVSAPESSISAVARKCGIAPNMMFHWRRAMDDAGDEGLKSNEKVYPESEVILLTEARQRP